MLEIYNVEVYGLERSIKASGNPMTVGKINTKICNCSDNNLTQKDITRGQTLGSAKSGSGHDNYLKGIIVQFDVKYPQYWTPEAQRYNWLHIVSSQSKMHRLTTAGTKDNFKEMFNKYVEPQIIERVQSLIEMYNDVDAEQQPNLKYELFMKALSNLPMGYEMCETITTNYLQLKTIYKQRKNHKLKEDWGAFISMCESLPMFLELIGEKQHA